MKYIREDKENLGGIILEYIIQLENQLEFKLKNQLDGIITIEGRKYKIFKILKSGLTEINCDNKKYHHLFSPNGCNISGKFLIKVQAEVFELDADNLPFPYEFEVHFGSINIKYNFDIESFSIEDDINISTTLR